MTTTSEPASYREAGGAVETLLARATSSTSEAGELAGVPFDSVLSQAAFHCSNKGTMRPLCRHAGPALLALLALAGCGDDSGDGAGGGGAGAGGGTTSTSGNTSEGFLEATIGGSPTGKSAMSITTLPGAYAEKRDTPGGERISVHGNVPGTSKDFLVGEQSLRIYLMPYDGLRTYTLGMADGAGAAYAELDDTHVFYAAYGDPYLQHGSGSITVTQRTDDRLVGSFSFSAEDEDQMATVTLDGTFDLPLVPDDG